MQIPNCAYYYYYHWTHGAGRVTEIDEKGKWVNLTFDVIPSDVDRFPELRDYVQVVVTVKDYEITDCRVLAAKV